MAEGPWPSQWTSARAWLRLRSSGGRSRPRPEPDLSEAPGNEDLQQ